MAYASTFVFSFPDNIYVEYAKVNTGDTPSEYSKYESGTSVSALADKSIYYKIYSLLENRDDRIIITGPKPPDYNLEVPENEIISVDGIDWILRKCVGYDGVGTNYTFNYEVFILIPDDEPNNPGDESDKEESSGINFTYDKTPKFREQETPHVYFDTVKGGFGGTETHTYTYEDASVTGTWIHPINGGEIVTTYYKVHDFMTPEELIGQILGDTYSSREDAITNEDIYDLSNDELFQNYPGTIKFMADLEKRGGMLISLDSAYTYDDNAGRSVSFPDPGVYLTVTSILTITKEVQTSPSPFSKNVTVKAHTEYTAHVNGRIGESGGVLNGYSFSKTGAWSTSDDYRDFDITGVANCNGSFETAKATLLAGKKVIGFINTKDKHPELEPVLFDTIIDDFWGSGLTGIKVDIGVRYSCLLASDNKLYLHHAE